MTRDRIVALIAVGALGVVVYSGVSGSRSLNVPGSGAGGSRMSPVAALLLSGLVTLAGLTLALLGWMAYRVRHRGGFGPLGRALLRGLAPLLVGPGGCALAVLVGLVLAPSRYQGPAVFLGSTGIAIGLCVLLAWLRPGTTPRTRVAGLLAGTGAALLGAWLGDLAAAGPMSAPATVVGATAAANLALMALDIATKTPLTARAGRGAVAG